jgi:hydrogenase maturation protease
VNEWEWSLLEDKSAPAEVITINGIEVRKGDRVRLHPRAGGDILDIALRDQIAIIESMEEDYEGAQHICVVVENDPGRDLGMMRQPGHRFFFSPAEIERLPDEEQGEQHASAKPSILIAGIGNIFLGDDGFGVEVARHLLQSELPDSIRVVDFGIRGLDLVYTLQDGYETTVLIDAYPHGHEPGTVSVLELDPNQVDTAEGSFIEPHSMHPLNVLRMAKSMNGNFKRVLLIGCEPAYLGGDEGHMGLSPAVEAAVEVAVKKTEVLIKKILDGQSI